jgi:hypothetical protein
VFGVFLSFIKTTERADRPKTQGLLREKWQRLPESLRTPQQLYGRHDEGCGATVGVMPRCDFACRGCYLGPDANSIPGEQLAAIKAQVRKLRPYLGRWGNLQLTDGEITLLPEAQIIEILRYARELELVPMLMTHGDTFRRKPELLNRLMIEGGLREISIHIDTTQSGRRGDAYAYAKTEAALNPLREEFADMIRNARRQTGLPLRAASTVTVSAENIEGVPTIVDWFLRNSDAFRLLSFLPVAKVGRTSGSLDGVDVDDLWRAVGEGLPERPALDTLTRRQWWLGHGGCNRIMLGMACGTPEGRVAYQAFSPDDPDDQHIYGEFCEYLGGLSFRGLTIAQSIRSLVASAIREPRFFFASVPRYVWSWLKRVNQDRPWNAFYRFATGRDRLDVFTIVSHHFMDRSQLRTAEGRERVENCVFRVPVNGELVSMCEFNADGGRDRYYANLRKNRSYFSPSQ